MLTKLLRFGKDGKNNKISENLFVPHVVAWELGLLVIVFCLFHCALSWDIALQDVYKLEHTQTFLFFLYYLDEIRFGADLFRLFVVVAEWIIYIRLYCRAKKSEKHWGSVLYFTIVMTLHIIICLHATFNQEPDYNVLTYIRRDYRFFANVTVSPSVVYCVVYIWHIWKLKAQKNGTGGRFA